MHQKRSRAAVHLVVAEVDDAVKSVEPSVRQFEPQAARILQFLSAAFRSSLPSIVITVRDREYDAYGIGLHHAGKGAFRRRHIISDMMERLADASGHGRIHFRVPQIEVGYGGGGLRLTYCGHGGVQRSLRRRERRLGGVAFRGGNAALIRGYQTLVITLRPFHLGLRDGDFRLCAGDFRMAQVLCGEILLRVDLKKEIPFLNPRSFGKAYAADVSVDLGKDIGHLHRFDVTDIFRRGIEERIGDGDDRYGRRLRRSRSLLYLLEANRFTSEPTRQDQR